MSCKDCKCGKKNVDLGAEAELRTAIIALRYETQQLRKQIKGGNRMEELMEHRFDNYQVDDAPWWKFWDFRSGLKGGLVFGVIIGSMVSLFLLGLKLIG